MKCSVDRHAIDTTKRGGWGSMRGQGEEGRGASSLFVSVIGVYRNGLIAGIRGAMTVAEAVGAVIALRTRLTYSEGKRKIHV